MITKLNLSSNPFRNRRLPLLLSAVMLFFALFGFLFLLRDVLQKRQRLQTLTAQNAQMQSQIADWKKTGDNVQKELSPTERALLVGAHKLVANKSFAWSRLFADLDAVMPPNVAASHISIENIFKDGDRLKADLDFSVLSRDYQSVVSMIDRMNSSGIFQAEMRGQDLQKNDHFQYTEFTLHLIYIPAVGYSTDQPQEMAQNNGGGNAQ